MERLDLAIIGGGAAGLFLANLLAEQNYHGKTVLFERGERIGRKLAATGNGQGNVTNATAGDSSAYFPLDKTTQTRLASILQRYTPQTFERFWDKRGVALVYDGRGRAYPASRQASSLSDALRFYLAEKGTQIRTSSKVTDLSKTKGGFLVSYEREGSVQTCFAANVLLCGGGKAAKNFGTDGNAYALATKLGHTVTSLYPSLVQLKTDTAHTKTLKGIRITDGALSFEQNGKECTLYGDIIFTDYGISGDAVFRASSYLTGGGSDGKELFLDFLPSLTAEKIEAILQEKRKTYPSLHEQELLFGVVNNQVGRAVMRRANGDIRKAASLVKRFPLTLLGSLGFDYAQVTKGGIPLAETDGDFQSKFADGLYFAGEILDVDGQCGGFNLHFAYASAATVAESLLAKQ